MSIRIYTSYFAIVNKLSSRLVPISIALKTPSWFNGLEYKKLAPTQNILYNYKNNGNQEEYIRRYTEEILGVLDIDTVINELGTLSNDNDAVLLCYEKDGPCHRHIVSQ